MLDKKSEDVLKVIISKYSGNIDDKIEITADDYDIHFSELNALCLNLKDLGYLNSFYYAYQKRPALVYLSYKGLKYFEDKKTDHKERLKTSIIVPIVVTLLTQLSLFLLKQLLLLIQELL